MSDGRRRGMQRRWVGMGMLGLLLSGCAGAMPAPDDLRVTAGDGGLYLLTRSTAVARGICTASGLDASRLEGRLFADGGPHFTQGIRGCQMQRRSVIICQKGDAGCVPGEAPGAQGPQGPEK